MLWILYNSLQKKNVPPYDGKKRTKKYSKCYYTVFKDDPHTIYLFNIKMQAFLMATKNRDIIVIS